MELNPVRLEKYGENEISDDIKDRLQFVLEMENIIIEREARGGFAKKEIGEMDFFLYKNYNHKYIQLAVGENKIWGNFEKQLKQLLGYLNKNINFGFTITINKNNTYQKIKDLQKEVLEKFNFNDEFKIINIEEHDDFIVSMHIIPEENKIVKIYHFIINANTQSRKEIAYEARNKRESNENKIEIKYLKKALEIAQNKYRVLDLLANKKINIFISNKKRKDFRSYLYQYWLNENFEIFIYTDKEPVYTLLYQLGSIINLVLCDEDEVIPKKFIKVNKKINIDLLENRTDERKIIFSDIFAITTLSNSKLENFAPFMLKPDVNKVLEEYFIQEIGSKVDNKKP